MVGYRSGNGCPELKLNGTVAGWWERKDQMARVRNVGLDTALLGFVVVISKTSIRSRIGMIPVSRLGFGMVLI